MGSRCRLELGKFAVCICSVHTTVVLVVGLLTQYLQLGITGPHWQLSQKSRTVGSPSTAAHPGLASPRLSNRLVRRVRTSEARD